MTDRRARGVVTKALAEEKRAAASRACWQAVRAHLKAHRALLTRRAAHHYRDRLVPGGLVVPDGWLPSTPLLLDEVELVWRDRAPAPEVDGSEPASEVVRPLLAGDERYRRYTDAMADLARPRMFEDRPCYRLLDVDVRDGAARLAFGRGSYFGLVDVCEAVAHEVAGDEMGEWTTPSGNPLAFRTLVGDPADLARRPVVPPLGTGGRHLLHRPRRRRHRPAPTAPSRSRHPPPPSLAPPPNHPPLRAGRSRDRLTTRRPVPWRCPERKTTESRGGGRFR